MRKQLITLILLIFSLFTAYSQQKAEIEFKITHLNDSIIYLGSYYGDKSVVVDTSRVLNQNTLIFNNDESYPGGIYFLVDSQKKKLFEFVLDEDQQFKIITDTNSYIESARIKGSNDNELFFNYVNFTNTLHDSVTKIRKLQQNIQRDSDSAAILNQSLKRINKTVVEYKEDFLHSYPDHVLSLVFHTIKQPQVPDSVQTQNNPRAAYEYYKKHYWDGIRFSDERLLRIPGFHDKLNTWFTKVVPQHPDSIIVEIDRMLEKAEDSKKVYNYLLWHFIEQYDQEKIMGFDAIFVHLAKTYFHDNKLLNTTESVRKQIVDRGTKLERILIGKVAPNLILLDTNNRFRSFMDIESDYTIIFFWDQDCGVCKDEINVLKDIMDTTALDIEIFAVCTDTNLSAWKKKIDQYGVSQWIHVNATRSITGDYHDLYDVYGTPLIFVLNRKKEIIAKKISADQIVLYLYRMKKNW